MKYTYSILPPLRKGESELHRDIVRLQSETNIRWGKVPDHHKYYWSTALLYRNFLLDFFQTHPDWKKTSQPDGADYCNFDQHSRLKNHLVSYPIQNFHLKHMMAEILSNNMYLPFTIIYNLKNRDDPLKACHGRKIKHLKRKSAVHNRRWFWKPTKGGGGRGIVVEHLTPLLDSITSKPRQQAQSGIFQQEIPDLLLFQNRKFELRYYVVLYKLSAHTTCLSSAIYNYPHAIIAKQDFDPTSHDRNKIITNRSFLSGKDRRNLVYQATLKDFPLKDTQAFQPVVMKALVDTTRQIVGYLNSHFNPTQSPPQYEVIALDFMIDKEYHPWLVEINRNPCVKIEKDMPDIKTLKKNFYHRLIDILIHGFYRHSNSNFVPVFPPSDWTAVS